MKTMRNCISKSAFTILHFTWLFVITFFFLIFLPRFPAVLGKQVFYGGRLFFSDKERRPLIPGRCMYIRKNLYQESTSLITTYHATTRQDKKNYSREKFGRGD